jgi:hypothetical protein
MAANPPTISKLFPSYKAKFGNGQFGDGGEVQLFYPVYSFEILPVSDVVCTSLVHQLCAMDCCCNNIQPNGIIDDIVDPSLHLCLLSKEESNSAVQQLDQILL